MCNWWNHLWYAEETIAFYPILIPVLLTAGYDVVTGIMVVFLGAGVGIVGGISNPFSVGIGSNIAGISLGDGILTRLVLFIACFIFAVFFVMRYAEKVERILQNLLFMIFEILQMRPLKKTIRTRL